jgi:cleavage stimulation factor subunit 2
VPTPPVAPPYQPPPQAAPAPAPPAQPDQTALIQQVLSMPQAMIDQLAPDQRAQIMQLRQQFGNQYPPR